MFICVNNTIECVCPPEMHLLIVNVRSALDSVWEVAVPLCKYAVEVIGGQDILLVFVLSPGKFV